MEQQHTEMALLSPTVPNDAGGHRSGFAYQVIPPTAPNLFEDSSGCMMRDESGTVLPVTDAGGHQIGYAYKVTPSTEPSMQREESGSNRTVLTERTLDEESQDTQITTAGRGVRSGSAWITTGVAENEMVEEHPGYHQEITGEQAERRLRRCGGHCYLTRFSVTQGCYVLSIHEQRKPLEPVIKHFKIVIRDDGRANINGKRNSFVGIRSLLNHYEHNRIDPALTSIGCAYTEEEYRRRRGRGCTIL